MISKLILSSTLVTIFIINSLGQDLPGNFKYYTTVQRPQDLRHALPDQILLDSTNGYLMVEYDYHPTYIEIFDTQNFIKIKRIKIWNFIYLSESYISDDGQFVYFDIGRWKNNYLRFNLKTFKKKHIPCKNAPKGCDFDNWETTSKYDGMNKIKYYENYIIKFNEKKVEIYLKKDN